MFELLVAKLKDADPRVSARLLCGFASRCLGGESSSHLPKPIEGRGRLIRNKVFVEHVCMSLYHVHSSNAEADREIAPFAAREKVDKKQDNVKIGVGGRGISRTRSRSAVADA